MSNARMNNLVAKELSDALARCKTHGVDEQSLRTGLLTITIANFVNRIGMENTVALFEALPVEIRSGIFDKYIDPNTNTPRATPYPQAAPTAMPAPPANGYPQPTPAHPPAQPVQAPPMSYTNHPMPTNFIQPNPGISTPAPIQASPQPAYAPPIPPQPYQAPPVSNNAPRRRLAD